MINAGGLSFTDKMGNIWQTDNGFITGQNYTTQDEIQGTEDQILYQSQRYNMTGYQFPVNNGIYFVTLEFAEIYPYCQYSGCRIFDVSLENTPVLASFDIFAQAGGYTALNKTFSVPVNDGILDINFHSIKNSASINAIKISR
jgi:large repetitive protein